MDPQQLMMMINGGFAGGYDPALGATMANNPEAVAQQLASQGVAPPPPQAPPQAPPSPAALGVPAGMPQSIGSQLLNSPRQQPMPAGGPRMAANPLSVPPAPQTLQGATAADADQGYNPSAGFTGPLPEPGRTYESTAPTGMPTMGSPLDIRSQAQKAGTPVAPPTQQQGTDVTKALAGVRAPAAPEAQKVSTPAAPRPNQLPADRSLVQLLAAVLGNAPETKPMYLQNALGGKR